MQLRLASHLVDGLVEDKNVMLMPASARLHAPALLRRVPTLLPASALQSTARFGRHLFSWRGAGAAGARTCALMLCIDAGRTICPEVVLDMSCVGIHADRKLPCVLHVYS